MITPEQFKLLLPLACAWAEDRRVSFSERAWHHARLMSWYAFDNGKSIGQRGSESGTIIRDEEHSSGARITLERDGHTAPLSITCGIYGWMVHTRFFGTESEARSEFEAMRAELSNIISTIPLAADPEADSKSQVVSESISEFVGRFP